MYMIKSQIALNETLKKVAGGETEMYTGLSCELDFAIT